MQPEQAVFLLNSVLIPALTNEHGITRRIIAAIPLDKGDFRPDAISKSALDLAWHTVATEMVFMRAVEEGGFTFAPNPRPDSIQNSADLISWYTENFAARLNQLPELSGEQLVKIVEFRGVFQLPAVMYLSFLLHHSVHHRGQLSMYLRPIGAKVPSIYGESFDAAEARKAAVQ